MKNLMPRSLSELFAVALSYLSLMTFIALYIYR